MMGENWNYYILLQNKNLQVIMMKTNNHNY